MELLLTPSEQELFSTLSPELQEGWRVQTEDVTAVETEQELRIRQQLSSVCDDDEACTALESLRTGKPVGGSLSHLPADLFREVAFVMGARGLTQVIESTIRTAKTDDDIRNIERLTLIRHGVLQSNASVSAS